MSETTPFTAGSSAQTAEGPLELGVTVSDDAMGVVVEAPFLGRLRAAFDVLGDGSARLSALTRRGADGVEVHVAGSAEVARIARLSTALDDSRSWEPRAHAAEASLAQSLSREKDLTAELATTRTTLHETEASLRDSRSELHATQTLLAEAKANVRRTAQELTEVRAALEKAEARLQRTAGELATTREEAQARQGAAGAELADATSRLVLAESERDTARAELDDTRARLETANKARASLDSDLASLKPLLDGTRSRLARTEVARDEALKKLKASEEGRETATAQLATVTPERDALQTELTAAAAELAALKPAHAAATRQLATVTPERDALKRELTAATTELAAVKEALASAQAAHAELEVARGSLAQTGADLTAARSKIDELTKTTQVLRGELGVAKQQRDDSVVRADELEQTAAGAQSRADALGAELGLLRTEHTRVGDELQEERSRREELLRDLAYIQSQVSDLASTKGALVSRVSQMTKREEQRRKTTLEFSDVLRTAEVVAADRLMDARRQQARAGKLEERVKDLEDQVGGLLEQLRDAQSDAAKVGPLTAERDRLKVEIAFFQKQIAAAQRARETAKK